MKKPIVQGVSVLGLLLGGGGSMIQAQGVNPYGTSPSSAKPGSGYPARPVGGYFAQPGGGYTAQPGAGYYAQPGNAGVAASATPMASDAPATSWGTPRPVRRVARMMQEPAPSMPTPTPVEGGGASQPATPQPSTPSSSSEPTSPNPEEMTLPRSESAGGGGEPTEAEAAAEEEAEAPERDETKLLMNALGISESPIKIYGWIQNSFTGNTLGTPKNDLNFGVNPNYQANRWMGNQYYLIIENPLEQNDRINFGFRVDNLFGNDWVFNHMRGFAENAWPLNHFPGYDLAQVYGEVHLPFLTKGGIDIKGGRFYTILGYEVVPAVGRPLLSVPYMFNYGQPFTHLGVLSTLHLTDRINILNGAVNGYDRWFSESWKWNYLGGWTWTSKDGKANFAMSYIFGPNQYPWFLQPNTQIVLLGNTLPPYLAGRRNPGYGANWRTSFTNVFSYKWTEKLTQVMENDDSYETNIPGSGYDGTNRNDSWYGFANWFLYAFNDKLTGVWRSEVFRDQGGQRLQTGFINPNAMNPRADTVYEMTLGMIWKPKPYIWVRPEARYDWSQSLPLYKDDTKKSQLTLAIDAILLF
jgi:hypothetical protein